MQQRNLRKNVQKHLAKKNDVSFECAFAGVEGVLSIFDSVFPCAPDGAMINPKV